MKTVLCIVALFCAFVATAEGHGYLITPPARGSAWRAGFKTPTDSNDMANFCGGRGVQHSTANGGKCAVCGEEYSKSMKRLEPGPANKFATGTIVGNYKQGETIDVTIMITAFHQGYFEFRLCENNVPQKGTDKSIAVTVDCLNRNLLENAEAGGTTFVATTGKSTHQVKLPADVSCSACVLQWRYRTGNNWGCEDDKCGSGLGPQEEFVGCADIAIEQSVQKPPSNPETTRQTTEVTTKLPDVPTTPLPTTEDIATEVTTETPAKTTMVSVDVTDKPEPTTQKVREVSTVKVTTPRATTQKVTTQKATTRRTTTQKATTPRATTQKATERPTTKTVVRPNGGKSCTGIGAFGASMTTWCNQNCNHFPPYCPRSHCMCN